MLLRKFISPRELIVTSKADEPNDVACDRGHVCQLEQNCCTFHPNCQQPEPIQITINKIMGDLTAKNGGLKLGEI